MARRTCKVIQAILRRSNVDGTLGYYIKPQSTDVIVAMEKFEAEMAAQSLRDNNGTPNLPSNAMPKPVNHLKGVRMEPRDTNGTATIGGA